MPAASPAVVSVSISTTPCDWSAVASVWSPAWLLVLPPLLAGPGRRSAAGLPPDRRRVVPGRLPVLGLGLLRLLRSGGGRAVGDRGPAAVGEGPADGDGDRGRDDATGDGAGERRSASSSRRGGRPRARGAAAACWKGAAYGSW